jgi:hypothetical protein
MSRESEDEDEWGMNSERVELRISPALLKIVDDWRRRQPDIPTRQAAIRQMVATFGKAKDRRGK